MFTFLLFLFAIGIACAIVYALAGGLALAIGGAFVGVWRFIVGIGQTLAHIWLWHVERFRWAHSTHVAVAAAWVWLWHWTRIGARWATLGTGLLGLPAAFLWFGHPIAAVLPVIATCIHLYERKYRNTRR